MKKEVTDLLNNFKEELCANCTSVNCDKRNKHISMEQTSNIKMCRLYS